MGPALFVRVWSTTLRLPKAPLTTDESNTLVEVELLLLILFCFGQNGWNILYQHTNWNHNTSIPPRVKFRPIFGCSSQFWLVSDFGLKRIKEILNFFCFLTLIF